MEGKENKFENYTRQNKHKTQQKDNVIRVKYQDFGDKGQKNFRGHWKYVNYAIGKLETEDFVTIQATGKAISTALSVIEKIKFHYPGQLYQQNKIHSLEVVDVYEPKFDNLERIEDKKIIAALDTKLSKEQLDRDDLGYQDPIPQNQKKPLKLQQQRPREQEMRNMPQKQQYAEP